MNDKSQAIAMLKDEFNRWEALLASLTEAQLTSPNPASGVPIKDVMTHLWGWQQRTIARTQAAILNQAPEFPNWPADLDPNAEEDTDKINAWIYASHRDQSWSEVYQVWRDGFHRLIELAGAVPEADMMTASHYAWLGEYSLADILQASYEHHEEHIQELLAWLHHDRQTPSNN